MIFSRTLGLLLLSGALFAPSLTVTAQDVPSPDGATPAAAETVDPAADAVVPTSEETTPAAPEVQSELPEVEVIQKKEVPAQPKQKAAAKPKLAPASPPPQPVNQASITAAPEPDTGDVSVSDAGAPSADIAVDGIFQGPQQGSTLNRNTTGVDGYLATGMSTATKTNTPIKSIPQSITIVTKDLAEDQGSNTVGEALRFVPGVIVQQGEGHRDQVTIRGQVTTADFFVDGVRDDIQTYRDLYNAETIEVLKGPAAMIFGRGGGGGVINRVTKKADGRTIYEGNVETGNYDRKRVTADVGRAVTNDFAFRLNLMYEDSATFRDFSALERYGFNPTMAFRIDDKTKLHVSYEYKVHDQNVDRGGPSINGRPFGAPRDRYFGQPHISYTDYTGHSATATLEHDTDFGLQIRNHASYGTHDKSYKNIFAASPVGAPGPDRVRLDGYESINPRDSFINQTDFSYAFNMGPMVRHNLVAGVEIGFQESTDIRNLPSFNSPGSGTNFLDVPVTDPAVSNDVFFDRPSRRRFTDLKTASFYVQDQIELTRYLEIIGGIRYERFDLDFRNGLNGTALGRVDEVWSPRVGAVIKPTDNLSLYGSYSQSFLPQSGDQFNNLTVAAANLKPEEFENYEIGFKWTIAPRLFLTGALYQLDRSNQQVTIGQSVTASGLTRTKGGELGLSGYLTDDWQVFGGYAYTDSEITEAGDNLTLAGNSVESVPRHAFSLWNRYQLTRIWGVGLGVVHKSSWFAEADNEVRIPGYTRIDGALYFDWDDNWSAQLNVENLFNEKYWISSHNDNNISYGAPTSAYVSIKAKY